MNKPESRIRPPIAFISGHRDLTDEEWNEHYVPHITEAVVAGHHFVVGDCEGVDTRAAHLLVELLGENIHWATMYHMWEAPRVETNIPIIGGFRSDDARDEAMTIASDYDIAWVRKGRNRSGTANNQRRRRVWEHEGEKFSKVFSCETSSIKELKQLRFILNMNIAIKERMARLDKASKV